MAVCGANERQRRLILAAYLIMYSMDHFRTINIFKHDREKYISIDRLV